MGSDSFSSATDEFAKLFHEKPIKRVGCLGAGHVGVSMIAVMAKKMPDVQFMIFDDNPAVVCACQSGQLPFYEPGMQDLIDSLRGKNLHFTSSIQSTVQSSQVIFVCINTPLKTSGVGSGRAADLSGWENMARRIAENSQGECKIVVECSTIPVTTGETMRKVLHAVGDAAKYEVLCFPSFYRGGTALVDLESPTRVLLGAHDTPAGVIASEAITKLLSNWIPRERIVHSNLWSAELSKLAQNAMKAQRISSTNAVSALCERTGADLTEVMRVVGSDSRIGAGYLRSCPGIGGPTLLSNLAMLVYLCESLQLAETAEYWRMVMKMNEYQKKRFCDNIVNTMVNIKNKKIAILGFAYKSDTSDARESPAIEICKTLLDEGGKLAIYDPQVSVEVIANNLNGYHPLQITHARSAEDAIKDAHAAIFVTEWPEFSKIDMRLACASMAKPPFLFDSRGLFDVEEMERLGFQVYRIGKSNRSA
uniref:UDP-glucose 6-dehydrogenase n=1 Tax=Hanusia phi TaxID=3032 RepID=A0A7S0NF08_9CRYP